MKKTILLFAITMILSTTTAIAAIDTGGVNAMQPGATPTRAIDTGGGKAIDTGGGKAIDTGGGKAIDTGGGKAIDTGGGKSLVGKNTISGLLAFFTNWINSR